jgi:hypothetical protein
MKELKIKDVHFFRPRGTAMRRETRVIKLVLTGWLLAIFCSQGFVLLIGEPTNLFGLNNFTFFNLQIPHWLTGQFLPLWFVILCVIFNFWMDSHMSNATDGSMRFRLRPAKEDD